MSILNNEGHDPQGLGNTPSRSELSRLCADNERLRAALSQIRLDCLSYATQHVGMARDQFLCTAGDAERAAEQKASK